LRPLFPNREDTPENIKWTKFWETPGSLGAEVIAGRLRAEGIPAWVWQQGAGAAMGMTFGPMGRGHVMVPEEQLEDARRMMATDLTPEVNGWDEWLESDLDPVDTGNRGAWLSKGILALTALAVSPIGLAAVFVVTKLLGGKENLDPECPDCNIVIDLDEEEENQGWFVCPECERTIQINK
jgi:hypothetical protein